MDRVGDRQLGEGVEGVVVNHSVTVLMAVYDTPAELLLEATDSVLAQTFRDFELLLIDDGSASKSPRDVLKRLEAHPRVRVAWEPHRGLTPTLNVGLRLARGEFIARHDADDWSDPNRLELQVSYMRAHPETAVVGSAACMHQHGGRPLWRVEMPRTAEEIERAFTTRNPFVHGATMFRRDAALRIGGYREALRCSQDYDFFWRLSEGGHGANLAEPLYHYRYTGGSVSAAKAQEQAVAHFAARILAEARKKGEPEDVEAAVEAARHSPSDTGAFQAELKQADHLMLAGEHRAAGAAYLRLLKTQPVNLLAWAKLARWGVFQTVPGARKVCFR
jgi:hypothetical protein